MIDPNIINFATFLASELRAMCIKGKQLYVTGNMQRSIVALDVNADEDSIEVVIATDYASYTNTRGRMAGWIEKTIQRCASAFSSNNDVEADWINGIVANIRYE